jgi:hypothetical protein
MASAILDPTGRTNLKRQTFAPRPASLAGATVGLLENTKQNAALFLQELGRLLQERHGVSGLVLRTKKVFALQVSEELLKELTEQCDVLITGVGDCGSCSASAVADGIAFESVGIPAAVICSEAFVMSADAMAKVQGVQGYQYATTGHPVASLTAGQVRERAEQVLPEVVALLLGQRAVRAT